MVCNRYMVVIIDELSNVETGLFIDLQTIKGS